MHGSPGRWDMVQCRAGDCGLLWLNPRPVAEQLPRLYENYFTHEAEQPGPRSDGLRVHVRRAIQRSLLGYPARLGAAARALAAVVQLVPWYRTSALRELFWLPFSSRGRLLDIGCGNGAPMQRFIAAGWTATGIDFDAAAVAVARSAGLDARFGPLKEHAFPDAQFDVILMGHVIEHLADPAEELKECRRILKPSGCLVIATPNALSLGHRLAGRHWPGLDVPRHLQVFTPKSLTRMVAMAGFAPLEVRTHAGIAANWLMASEDWRVAERTGRCARLPAPSDPIPLHWLALARLQSMGVALGARWGDELVGRYAPAPSSGPV
ncbi:MAG TPA: class I SAM-dependent methyltransferase [Burkholderiaceae bacterium]|nr:class I SAM-dependent methyltransferase [Burkholderiaceae bacterium]